MGETTTVVSSQNIEAVGSEERKGSVRLLTQPELRVIHQWAVRCHRVHDPASTVVRGEVTEGLTLPGNVSGTSWPDRVLMAAAQIAGLQQIELLPCRRRGRIRMERACGVAPAADGGDEVASLRLDREGAVLARPSQRKERVRSQFNPLGLKGLIIICCAGSATEPGGQDDVPGGDDEEFEVVGVIDGEYLVGTWRGRARNQGIDRVVSTIPRGDEISPSIRANEELAAQQCV